MKATGYGENSDNYEKNFLCDSAIPNQELSGAKSELPGGTVEERNKYKKITPFGLSSGKSTNIGQNVIFKY